MSIATLKRKTAAQHHTMSTGRAQFSLNGTYRSQGYIGQTSLSRPAPRTLMRGDVALGSGACCNSPIANVVPAITSQNDITVVKPSVLSSRGRIAKRYPWITGGSTPGSGFERNHVGVDGTHSLNTQGAYILSVVNASLAETLSCSDVEATYSSELCHIVASPSITGAIPQSSYLRDMASRNCETAIPRYYRTSAQTPFDVCANV